MPVIPRSARAPLTAKQPDACPHCGGHSLTRRGTRKKKLEIVQLWRCASCKRTFTPGPEALRNKTYPLRMILSALTDYDTGFTLEETAARLKKKTNRNVSTRRAARIRRDCGTVAARASRPLPANVGMIGGLIALQREHKSLTQNELSKINEFRIRFVEVSDSSKSQSARMIGFFAIVLRVFSLMVARATH